MREPVPIPVRPSHRKREGARSYQHHGYHALKLRVKVAGTDALDRRTHEARDLLAWTEEQIAHLGGRDEITHPEMTIIKRASVLEVLLRQAESDLLQRGVLITRGEVIAPHPLLGDYRHLVHEQREILRALGLKRRPKKLPTLGEYISKTYGGRETVIEATPTNGHAEPAP